MMILEIILTLYFSGAVLSWFLLLLNEHRGWAYCATFALTWPIWAVRGLLRNALAIWREE